jgi:putative ABC transport system substrate-binding protein
LLVNPTNPVSTESTTKDVQAAALALGLSVEVVRASNSREIEEAFATMVQKRSHALVIAPDPFLTARRVQLATLAVRHLLPSIYGVRDYADVGGLLSYGPNQMQRYREVGRYTGRILNGERPADMPVAQPTMFEFVVNVPTAHALGIMVPPSVLAQADEVIE